MNTLQLNVRELNSDEAKMGSELDNGENKVNSSDGELEVKDKDVPSIRLYKRRFVYLMVISVGSLLSDITYSQYSIISDTLTVYYGVSVIDVQWTSLIYSFGYIVPVYPILVMIQRKGIKITFVCGLFVVALGMWIQGIGTYIKSYGLIMFGQCVISCVQCCFVNITPQFVSYWFPVHDISTACAVGIFFNIAGMAFSCIFSPMILSSYDGYTIAQKLSILNFVLASLTTLLTALAFFVLEERPPSPPSEAQAQIWYKAQQVSIWPMLRDDLKRLLRNWNFVIHLWSAGAMLSFVAFSGIILNQLLIIKYPGHSSDIGAIGLVMYFMGIPGTLAIGRLIDKTRKYKEVIVVNNVIIVLSVCFFVGSIYINIATVYVASALFGFFLIGYINLALEFSSEITYPVDEVTTSSLILFVGSVIGIAMTYLTNWLLRDFDIYVSLIVLVIFSLIPAVMSVFVKADLRRLETEEKKETIG